MPEAPKNEGGVIDSARRMARSLLGLVQTRIELFSVELQEEKLRTADHMLWFALALAFTLGGVLLAIGTLALFLWQTSGYPGLIGLVVGTLATAGLLVWIAYRRIQNAPKPFTSTVAEFRKDIECLRPRD
jgi:uncharacterized membrane protein YqjE